MKKQVPSSANNYQQWKEFHGNYSNDGFSLLELLICLALISIISLWAVHSFTEQVAIHHLDNLANRFIQDAQLARQKSLQLGTQVSMKPLMKVNVFTWSAGWEIKADQLLVQSRINHSPIQVAEDLLKPTQQFTDMSAPLKARHLTFRNGQPALLHNGGFVANRIIWRHSSYPELIRHIILGPGGRWRICNPQEDKQECQ